MTAKDDSPGGFDRILVDEINVIKEQRKTRDPESGIEDEVKNLTGLALSGGGIRSASFALGVLQSLAKNGILKKVDYLSTVSGGGYIGSSLTWFLHKAWGNNGDEIRYGTDPDRFPFPFGERGKGARTRDGQNIILDFIRQHGNYLDPGHGLNSLSLFAVVVRSIIISFAVYYPLMLALLFWLFKRGAFTLRDWSFFPGIVEPLNFFMASAVVIGLVFIGASVIYSWGTASFFTKLFQTYRLRTGTQKWLGRLLALFLTALAIGSLPLVKGAIEDKWLALSAGGSTILGAAGGLLRYIMVQQKRKWQEGASSNLLAWAASALLIYGLVMLAYLPAHWFYDHYTPGWKVYPATLAPAAAGLLINLNYVSLHRMYRDRLMETFLPDFSSVASNKWGPAKEANRTLLSSMCPPDAAGPYHIVNTNVILVDSGDSKYRGRGGDNFVLSPLYCGSYATGWCETKNFIKGKMTLSTAMAISGAAVNPHAGVAGRGPTRSGSVSFLMTFLNLGLGYWVNNPKKQSVLVEPNYLRPGLKGLFGQGFDEDSTFIQLSDGGHFDNTGLYELIRRKAKTILLSDAGADPECAFGDFANAVEKVRVDFGVNIKFEDKETDLAQMMADKTGTGPLYEKYRLSKKGFAIGAVEYPCDRSECKGTSKRSGCKGTGERPDCEETGTLYYIKPELTPDLPADLYGYKSANPAYPHQSTTDQFFDETQFEAYRELGYRLAESMVASRKNSLEKALKISIDQ